MESIVRLGIIGAGGFVGAVLRYLVSGWVQYRSGSLIFPFGTMSVNMIGCLVIGFMTYLVESRSMFSPELRSFVLIGLLGAFTTFSTFGNETLGLIRDNRIDLAVMNGGFQVFVGVGMVWLGRILAANIWR
ncbi:MAG TPA: fluoride efflux transporter CrcB [Desulfobulbaceae bacterium]|nr:fluoride efflux transporter CrcB [Desulfobulbaceae bacterium]